MPAAEQNHPVSLVKRVRTLLGYWRRVIFSRKARRIRTLDLRRYRLDRASVPRDERLKQHAEELRAKIGTLPPIAVRPTAEDEIHLLCGHSHVPLGCFALWSFLRWVRFDVAVYVHSDGTLDPADRLAWSSVFPNINIVSREQSAAAATAFFAGNDLPLLKRLSAEHVYGKKVLDLHLFGMAKRFISLDTDILFFRNPEEFLTLWQEVSAGRRGIISTFDDIDNFYVSDLKTVARLVGSIPERFNSGMCILEKFGPPEFLEIEGILQAFAKHEPDLSQHLWVEQTIYAVMAARRTPYRMSSAYQLGGALGEPVAVHYAGLYRELFYTEGIPMLLKSM